jgi:hypothetical protein
MVRFLCFVLVTMSAGCTTVDAGTTLSGFATLKDIFESPTAFDGKRIRLRGFAHPIFVASQSDVSLVAWTARADGTCHSLGTNNNILLEQEDSSVDLRRAFGSSVMQGQLYEVVVAGRFSHRAVSQAIGGGPISSWDAELLEVDQFQVTGVSCLLP